jgi:hypothetical protein
MFMKNIVKYFVFFMLPFFVISFASFALAEEIDNSIALSLNPSGDFAENSYYNATVTGNNTISFDWEEKAYYGQTDDTTDKMIHPRFSVSNVGDTNGTLYVKFDLLSSAAPQSRWVILNETDNLQFTTLGNSTNTVFINNFEPDETIYFMDFIVGEDFRIDYPILISALLEDGSSNVIGFDTGLVFFNTNIQKYVKDKEFD